MSRSVLGEFGVVIVEPNAAERARLLRVLQRAPGFDVRGAAATGTEAIEVAASCQPHLVLLRLDLPDLAGYAVTSLLVARHPGLAIVVLAREGEEAAARLAGRMGAVGCLTAGSREEAIIEAARSALGTVLTGHRATPRQLAAEAARKAQDPPEAAVGAAEER
ncbi:MAG: response regulator transcription factor [Chloroflexi bacterium]|nr:MAG: response regulator transcription factor [Chloroflexota bacterium]